ncbi:hypothetical protein OEZ86_003458 [Tetradesmus obliquus]|nr:hypothetical protein OEZ86_003458 [Tetradesmus obliquus]
MAALSHSREELVQSIDELQGVVSERCLKTDQLGAIFAARDNMYGAWMKMQAVFESNKSQNGGRTSRVSGSLFKMRPSLTLSPVDCTRSLPP